MSLLTRPREWLDAHSDRLHAFLRFLGRRFLEDRCFDSAATLAYATLFAAVPVIAIWWSTRSSPVPAPIPAPPLATRQAPPNAEMPVVQPRATPTPTPATAPAAPVVTTPPPAAPAVAAANAPPPPPAPAADPPAAVGMAGVKLSMHVWNDDPARRFVVLNGQRMLEGERNGDLLLVEVLRDGVLVERDGQRARIDLP